MQMVIEDSLRIIKSYVENKFVLGVYNKKLFIRGLKGEDISAPSRSNFIELQKAEITLVTTVTVYLAHILVSLLRLESFMSEELDFTAEELEYIIEKLDEFIIASNINFFNSLPSDMFPIGFRGITNVIEAVFDSDGFPMKGISESDKNILKIYDGYKLYKILETVSEAYVMKRVNILNKIDEDKLKQEEAAKRAAAAEAELLASLSVSNKGNKTKKSKKSLLAEKPAEKPADKPADKPVLQPTLSEKELKKAEADAKNRQKQLMEKQRKLEEEQRRNEEIMKKFLSVATPVEEKALSPKALSQKALSPKALSPKEEKALSPKALSPTEDKALSSVADANKRITDYFTKDQLAELRKKVLNKEASMITENEYPNMAFTESADETFKFLVRTTLYILSEITKVTGQPFFCLKGGKILQLTQPMPYISDDIDILVLNQSHKTAAEIAALIKNCLLGYPISVLDKSKLSGTPQNLIKMSYGSHTLKAFLDIDFAPTPAYAEVFFSNLRPVNFGSLMFYAQSPLQYVDEKVFFHELYKIKCESNTEPHNINVCNYQIAKFQKVLKVILPLYTNYLERVNYLQPLIAQALPIFTIA
jgi:hypothetical protein